LIARLARFYSLKPDDILNLDQDIFLALVNSMPAIEAQETMQALKAADWPNMKKEARNRLFKDLNKRANPIKMDKEEKPLTTADLAALLNGR
jgi:hypothetical protein